MFYEFIDLMDDTPFGGIGPSHQVFLFEANTLEEAVQQLPESQDNYRLSITHHNPRTTELVGNYRRDIN